MVCLRLDGGGGDLAWISSGLDRHQCVVGLAGGGAAGTAPRDSAATNVCIGETLDTLSQPDQATGGLWLTGRCSSSRGGIEVHGRPDLTPVGPLIFEHHVTDW